MSISLTNFGIIAGLVAAICWGVSDFYSSQAADKTSTALVSFFAYSIDMIILIFAVALTSHNDFFNGALKLSAYGIFAAIGYVIFLYGLAKGKISIVVPIEALVSLAIPVLATLYSGYSLSLTLLFGLITIPIAVGCISYTNEKGGERSNLFSVACGVVAGLALGIYLIGLGDSTSQIIPRLFFLQLPGLIMLLVWVMWKKIPFAPLKTIKRELAFGVGFSTIGYLFFFISENYVSLIIAALLTGLYPGVTVALARIIKREYVSRLQYFGFAVAFSGVFFLSVGLSH